MTTHLNGLEHLQVKQFNHSHRLLFLSKRAKRHLEEQPQQALKLNEKVLQLLQANSSQNRSYRCNVCLQSYNLGSTLDTHLRSVAHQTRMNRLNELVASGEIDPKKPVSEQPNGIPQKIISELVDSVDVNNKVCLVVFKFGCFHFIFEFEYPPAPRIAFSFVATVWLVGWLIRKMACWYAKRKSSVSVWGVCLFEILILSNRQFHLLYKLPLFSNN